MASQNEENDRCGDHDHDQMISDIKRLCEGKRNEEAEVLISSACPFVINHLVDIGILPEVPGDVLLSVNNIFKIYHHGGSFYWKDLFRDLEARLDNLDHNSDQEVAWEAINGDEIKLPIRFTKWPDFDRNRTLTIKIRHMEEMVKTLQQKWKNPGTVEFAYSSVRIRFSPKTEIALKDLAFYASHFAKAKEIWLQSSEHTKLVAALEKDVHLAEITKIVCFGLGDFDRDLPDSPTCPFEKGEPVEPRAAIHHAAALTAQEIVCRKTGKEVQLFSQEPGYSETVKGFVESQGFTVYSGAGRDSHGFIDADDDTLVICIFPGVPVRAVLADVARPPIIIATGCLQGSYDERLEWYRSVGMEEIPQSLDPDDDRVRDMFDDYDATPLVGEMHEIDLVDAGPFARVFVHSLKDEEDSVDSDEDLVDSDEDLVDSDEDLVDNED
ncbi:hypothetical protein F4779DRAFT_636095 [Xylariaceae sp. FL0662B]|nr:hypothetical protein F4779DRAFT_636095 [Xylariaceae sp. FL0662B]